MKPHEIKVEIYRRRPDGLTITKIAKTIGVTKQSVALVIERRMTSRRIAQGVADALGLPLESVFPEMADGCDRRAAACA
jgi:DNA-binding XRE family transcriptional regulator